MQEGARAPSAPPPSWATVEDKQYKLQEKLSTAVSIKEFVIKDKDKIKTMWGWDREISSDGLATR